MGKKRILILEDEYITQETLSSLLQEKGYKISGTAMSAIEAIEILEDGETDLAILDIKVKGEKDGIWVAEQIRKKYKIPYLFLTAFKDDDTLKNAIETAPSGYLIKPFNDVDVFASVEVALKNQETLKEIEKSQEHSSNSPKHFFVKTDYLHVKLDVKNIIYIQSSRNYIEIFFDHNKQLLRKTMVNFLQELPPYFIQVHRSHVVNLYKVDSFSAGFVRLGEKEVPLSEKFRDPFLEKLKLL